RRLWELGLVRSLPELYRLTKEQLLELDGYAEISATHAIASIQASTRVPFSRVLLGLNIPDVGWVTAQNLARHFESVDRLGEGSQGHGVGLVEDDRARRRRGAGPVEADEGAAERRAAAHRSGSARATEPLAPSRSGPAPRAPTRTRSGGRC